MRLITYLHNNCETVGVVSADGARVHSVAEAGLAYGSMLELIKKATPAEMSALRTLENAAGGDEMSALKIIAPIPEPERSIICVGKNYLAHVEEFSHVEKSVFDAERAKSGPTIYFSKYMPRCSADGDPIPTHADITSQLDYEVELAVIIGHDAVNVPIERAGEYIFGYSIINDVSARDLQMGRNQWFFGKSLTGFAPLGPAIVTADEIAFPPALDVRLTVNGELRQQSNTSLFIHPIEKIIAELSSGMTLKAGTIIATGTPGGVGVGFTPPKFLKPGDTVVCEIEKIGTLTNTVESGNR